MNSFNSNTGIIVIVLLLAILFFGGFGYGMMGCGNYGGAWGMMSGFYGNFWFMWIFMILTVAASAIFIIWLIKQIQKPNYYKNRK